MNEAERLKKALAESERVRLLTEQLNAQAKSHAEEGERWSREMGELKRELEALKAAPARVEREVESELRTAMAAHPTWALSDDVLRGNVADETMRLILAGRAWLAAPLSAAPAQDEYTKAAVKYAEASLRYQKRRSGAASELESDAYQAFLPLYDARKRGDVGAAKVEPAKSCDDVIRLSASEVQSGHYRVRWAEGLIEQLPCGHEGRNSWLMNYGVKEEAKALREGRQLGWDEQTQSATLAHAAKVEPAPAEERVTLYVRQFASGEIGIMYSQSEREREPALIDGDRWLALEATVVREGGGEKGGAS